MTGGHLLYLGQVKKLNIAKKHLQEWLFSKSHLIYVANIYNCLKIDSEKKYANLGGF